VYKLLRFVIFKLHRQETGEWVCCEKLRADPFLNLMSDKCLSVINGEKYMYISSQIRNLKVNLRLMGLRGC
jgi:hypothetical protein